MQDPTLLEILHLLGGHQGQGESPNVLNHIHSAIHRFTGVLSMAKHGQSSRVGFLSSPSIHLPVVLSNL